MEKLFCDCKIDAEKSAFFLSGTKDAARYRWLRENGLANEKRESRAVLPRGGKKASMAFRYWTTPEELDMTIDAMIAAVEDNFAQPAPGAPWVSLAKP